MPQIELDTYKETDKSALINGISDLQEIERAIANTRRPGVEVAGAYVEQLLKQVAEKSGAIFTARAGDEVAGFIACWMERHENVAETAESNTYGYIMDAYVAPEYRGKGVFKQLNARAEDFLRERGATLIRITVLAENAPAVRAYKSAGYSPEEVIMMKRL